jgi:hypothetical protein
MRDRLIELLRQGDKTFADKYTGKIMAHIDELYDFIADYLLENGVVVPPFKIGQEVYAICRRSHLWWRGKIISFYKSQNDTQYAVAFEDGEIAVYDEDAIFLTKEEAERALKGDVQE